MGAGQGLALESKALISPTSGLQLGLGNGMDLLHSSSRVGQKHWQIRAKSGCTAEAFNVCQIMAVTHNRRFLLGFYAAAEVTLL